MALSFTVLLCASLGCHVTITQAERSVVREPWPYFQMNRSEGCRHGDSLVDWLVDWIDNLTPIKKPALSCILSISLQIIVNHCSVYDVSSVYHIVHIFKK